MHTKGLDQIGYAINWIRSENAKNKNVLKSKEY